MSRIGITGISGYLGTLVLRKLEKREDVECIVGIDWKPPMYRPPKLEFSRRDIRDRFGDVLVQHKVDRAMHLAFAVRPGHDDGAARRINIDGARNFLRACEEASVKGVLYLSSHTAYGPHPDNAIPLTETSPLRPIPSFQYSWDKAEADRMFQAFGQDHPGRCVTVVRACSILGPNGAGSVSTGMFKSVMIRISGYDPLVQFLHEDDLAELLVMLILRGHRGVFNAGGSGPLRYREIIAGTGKPCIALPAGVLSVLLDATWRLRLQSESPPGGLEFIKHPLVMSTRKVEEETGFRFRFTTRDALLSYLGAPRRKI